MSAYFDQDMRLYTHVPFSLELMKCAAYYKKNNQITVMSPSFSPHSFTKFIYRKDYLDDYKMKDFLAYDNIEYGGLAFSNNRYIPMADEIERCVPDTSIYSKFEWSFSDTNAHAQAFKVMTRAEHLRLSLDGKTVWPGFATQIKSLRSANVLFFHDVNLNDIEDARKKILYLTSKMKSTVTSKKIGSKFPIHVYNEQELLDWTIFLPTAAFYSLEFDGVIDDEAFCDFIINTKNTTISDQLIYNITRNCASEEDFIQNKLPQIFKQVVFSRRYKRKIRLTYDINFFKDRRWERVIELIGMYSNIVSSFQAYPQWIDTPLVGIVKFFKDKKEYPKDIFLRDEAIDLFSLVQKECYELFDLFYQCYEVELKNGRLELV